MSLILMEEDEPSGAEIAFRTLVVVVAVTVGWAFARGIWFCWIAVMERWRP